MELGELEEQRPEEPQVADGGDQRTKDDDLHDGPDG